MKYLCLLVPIFFSLNALAIDRVCLLNETDQEIQWTLYRESLSSTLVNFPSPAKHTYQCEVITDASSVNILISSQGKEGFSCSAMNVKLNDVIAVRNLKNGLNCRSLRNDTAVVIQTPGNKSLLNKASIVKSYERSDDFVAFSPLLINQTLQSHSNVQVRTFEPGKGLGATRSVSFSEVDLNLWAMQSLKLLDELLTNYDEKIKIIDESLGKAFLKKLIEIKATLAKTLSTNIDTVLTLPKIDRESDRTLFTLATQSYERLFSSQLARAFSEEALIISLNSDPSEIPPVFIEKIVPDRTYLEAKWDIGAQKNLSEWSRGHIKLNYPTLRLSDTLELSLVDVPQVKLKSMPTKNDFFALLASINSSYPALKKSMQKDLGKVQENQDGPTLLRSKVLLESLVTLMEELPKHWTFLIHDEVYKEFISRVYLEEKSFNIEGESALVVMLNFEGKDFELSPEFDGLLTEKGPVKSSFIFRKPSGKLLTWAEAQNLNGKSLILKTSIFSKNSFTARLIRNRMVFSNNPAKPEFHLKGNSTLQVMKPPFIHKNEVTDLRELIDLEEGAELASYLSTLVEGIMGDQTDTKDYSIKLEVSFESRDRLVSLPVMMLPNIPLSLEEWRQQTSPAIQQHIENWRKQTAPNLGRFVFDITLFGKDIDERVLPLVRVSKLYFEY